MADGKPGRPKVCGRCSKYKHPQKKQNVPGYCNCGRPRAIDGNPEVIRKLEEAAAFDATIEEMCFYANIGVQTLYDYFKKNPKFSERLKALRENPVLLARKTVVGAIPESGSFAFGYLKQKRPNEFGSKVIVEHQGDPLTAPAMTPEMDKIRKEYEEKMYEAAKNAPDEPADSESEPKQAPDTKKDKKPAEKPKNA